MDHVNLNFILGAKKAGTTFLADMLNQHPEIQVPREKEPRIFMVPNPEEIDRLVRRHFDGSLRQICVDASVGYSVLAERRAGGQLSPVGNPLPIPTRIHARFPGAKLIFLLRDPIDRLYSDYVHDNRSKGDMPVFEDWVELHPEAILRSRYNIQIRRYLEYFDLSQFMFVSFQTLVTEPLLTARQVSTFLGVRDTDFCFDIAANKNEGVVLNEAGALIASILGSKRMDDAISAVRATFPAFLKDALKAKLSYKPAKPVDLPREKYARLFRADMEDVHELTGLEFLI
ncbi:MAG: sulfotransferase [Pseudomonadota bacterium]